MKKGIRYTEEFKQVAVKQVVVHGYPVLEVSNRLGITNKSLYHWITKYGKPEPQCKAETDLLAENARLKKEVKRLQQEREILKGAAEFFA